MGRGFNTALRWNELPRNMELRQALGQGAFGRYLQCLLSQPEFDLRASHRLGGVEAMVLVDERSLDLQSDYAISNSTGTILIQLDPWWRRWMLI